MEFLSHQITRSFDKGKGYILLELASRSESRGGLVGLMTLLRAWLILATLRGGSGLSALDDSELQSNNSSRGDDGSFLFPSEGSSEILVPASSLSATFRFRGAHSRIRISECLESVSAWTFCIDMAHRFSLESIWKGGSPLPGSVTTEVDEGTLDMTTDM